LAAASASAGNDGDADGVFFSGRYMYLASVFNGVIRIGQARSYNIGALGATPPHLCFTLLAKKSS